MKLIPRQWVWVSDAEDRRLLRGLIERAVVAGKSGTITTDGGRGCDVWKLASVTVNGRPVVLRSAQGKSLRIHRPVIRDARGRYKKPDALVWTTMSAGAKMGTMRVCVTPYMPQPGFVPLSRCPRERLALCPTHRRDPALKGKRLRVVK